MSARAKHAYLHHNPADAPPSPRQYEAQDGTTDRQWARPFPWTRDLRDKNLKVFANRSFRWGGWGGGMGSTRGSCREGCVVGGGRGWPLHLASK